MTSLMILRAVLAVHLLSITLMSATGFLPLLRGSSPQGWMLLTHGACASIYLLSLTITALCFAGAAYLTTLERGILTALLWSGVVTSAAMILAMTSLFPTDGQHFLTALHRWSSIPAAFFGILFVSLGFLREWPGRPY